ncbi:MAG TPA: alpha/beta hydrolase [Bryobacteraceae bacterium]
MDLRPSAENPALRIVNVDGLDLAVWEWPGAGPPLIFAHATGFHGRLWDYIIRRLPGRRCLAVETRGHGRSARPDPPYRWRYLGKDLAGMLRSLGVRGAFGIGHSSGGHSMVQAAALVPEAFAAMLLIDPTIFPVFRYGGPAPDFAFILRRKNVWRSPEEMIERFRNRAPFVTWLPEILRDYCQYGLLPNGDHLSLACPPAAEASIYAESIAPESNIYAEVAQVAVPVTILRAGIIRNPGKLDLAASPTAPDLAARFIRGRDVVLEGASHFIPMEAPDRVIEEVRGMCGAG